MTYHPALWNAVSQHKGINKRNQHSHLLLGEVELVGLAILGHTPYEADTQAVSIVPFGMGTYLLVGPAVFYGAVAANHIVIANRGPAVAFRLGVSMPFGDLLDADIHTGLGVGTVNYDSVNLSH